MNKEFQVLLTDIQLISINNQNGDIIENINNPVDTFQMKIAYDNRSYNDLRERMGKYGIYSFPADDGNRYEFWAVLKDVSIVE